ncbi:MAG TPA: polysaccharide deacetylase family protein [Polyangiaceae bacterium]|jgi:peptidoglycan/xylan/chitin deacetylase (PgdA/CDA1 family)
MSTKKLLVVLFAPIVVFAACGGAHDTSSTASSALTACPWDPGFGQDQCDQGDWWLEFSVSDAATTSMSAEVSDPNGNRTIALTNEVDLGDGNVKFTGGPDDGPVPAGTLIRLTATKGQATAQTGWFAYMQDAPAIDCSGSADGGTDAAQDSGSTKDAGVDATEACAPNCAGRQCGSDGCGGTCGTCTGGTTCSNGACVSGGGCVAPWSPFWQQTSDAGSWWVEYVVAGGGSLPVSVTFQVVGGSSYPLSYAYGKWTGGLDGVASGTSAMLLATDATGATAKTLPFQYLVDQNPSTDPCGGTPSKSQSCLPLTRGMLTITMDDSYESQDTLAKPVLDKYGYKATIYNITRQLDQYGDLPFAKDLASDGMETGSHTVTHPDLTTLDAQDLDDELRLSQQYLLANVGSPVASFATPMGNYNPTVLAAIKKYYTSHRTVNPGLNYMGSDVFQLNSDGAYDNDSASTICSWIQNAATQRGWEILMFHDFTTDATSNMDLTYPIADFESILQCAKATAGIDVVTTTQGADAIRCASP